MKRFVYFTAPGSGPNSRPEANSSTPRGVAENTAVAGSTPEVQENERQAEMDRIKGRIGATGEKVKAVATQLNQIQTKVQTLGFRLENRLQTYLQQKTGINALDLNNAENAQTAVTEWVNNQELENIETLRQLDRNLDLVDLRVQFRKGLQERLDQIGDGIQPPQMKEDIGQALEYQLDRQEGAIQDRQSMTLAGFKRSLELTHEITKYANLLSGCKGANATSLSTATYLPDFAIAYPQTSSQNPNVFKYFTRQESGKDIVYCIDTTGMVQKLNPFKQEDLSASVWEVVYRPAAANRNEQRDSSFPASEFPTNEITQHRANITAVSDADWQKMMQNFTRERTFISAASRGLRGMPAAELSQLEGLIGRKWQEFQTQHVKRYQSTPGIESGNHPIRQTFDFVQGGMRQELQTIARSSSTLSNRPRNGGTTPSSTTETNRKTPERNQNATSETVERIPTPNRVLRWPSNGNVPLGNLEWSGPTRADRNAGESRRIASLSKDDSVRNRIVRGVFINNQPANAFRVDLGGNGTSINLKGRSRNETRVQIVLEDTLDDGTKRYERVNLNITAQEELSRSTRMDHIRLDEESVTKGAIDSSDMSTTRIARLLPAPTVERDIAGARISGGPRDGQAVSVSNYGGQIVLDSRGPNGRPQRIEAPATLIVDFTMRRWEENPNATRMRPLRASLTIQLENPPLPPEQSVEMLTPANGQVDVGEIQNQSLRRGVILGRLRSVDSSVERKVFLPGQGDPQEHPFLALSGSTLYIKRGVNVSIPRGQFQFRIGSRDKRSTGPWRLANHSLQNQEHPPTDLNTIMGSDRIIRREQVRPSDRSSLVELPDMAAGYTRRRIAEISTNIPDIPGVYAGPRARHFSIDPSDIRQKKVLYTGNDPLEAGAEITLFIENQNGAGQWLSRRDVVTLKVEAPGAYGNEEIQFRNGEVQDGFPKKTIQLGPRSTAEDPMDLGVRLSSGVPFGDTIRVSEVRLGTRTSPIHTRRRGTGNPIEIDRQGRFQLQPHSNIPAGPTWVKLHTIRNGQHNDHWVLIQNEGENNVLPEDAMLMSDTFQTNDGQFGPSHTSRLLGRLFPARPGVVDRELLSVKTADTNNPIEGITFNNTNGTILMNEDAIIYSDKTFVFEFRVTAASGTTQTRTVNLQMKA